MPYRLIDIELYRQGRARLIELHDTADPAVNIEYAALSHCWDGQSNFNLQSSNISSFKQGIRVDQRLKTFRNAIQVCDFLDIRCLWIDSLCNMQDCRKDWLENAATM